MRAIRVVFDTNIFSNKSFDALEQSPLRRLFLQKRVLPVYGHVFVEETLRAYGSEGKREQLINKWLPFVIDTCESICNDFDGIFHEELVCGRGTHARILLRKRDYERFKSSLINIPLDGTWRAWKASHFERERDNEKRNAQRELSKEVRAEVTQWKQENRYRPNTHGIPDLKQYLRKELIPAGREFLSKLVPAKNVGAVADMWARNPWFYPYFTTLVRDMLYISFYAMTRPNAPLDINAQADLNVMSHLLNAEILVTDEQGFMRTAFDDLWKENGKVCMSGTQFMQYLERL
jgi:hypothetical protein